MLTPLAKAYPELEERQQYGWGQQAMRLDRLPPTFRAFGVRIAVIGSGVSADHPDLKQRCVPESISCTVRPTAGRTT